MEMKIKVVNASNCPICDYPFDMCQCRFSGTAHPDRYKRARVVADHIYLLSDKQIEHLKQVQKLWSISYGDEEMKQILKELKSEELEQEPILDKIRSKIEKTKTTMNMFNREDTKQYVTAMEDVLKIIDKCKAESEGE